MEVLSLLRKTVKFVFLSSVAIVLTATTARAAVDPPYQFNLLEITHTLPGEKPVITFSVTDPNTGTAYDIKSDPAFTTGGVSSLSLQIGWDTKDYNNAVDYAATKPSGCPWSPGAVFGNGAAMPIPLNALSASTSNGDGTFTATSPCPIPLDAVGTGAVGMYGRAAGVDPETGLRTVRVRVTSKVEYFPITDSSPVERRTVVDVNKCLTCHGVAKSDGSLEAPIFSFHGDARTNEPKLCVICHNPNQTDIPFRVPGDPTAGDGSETPVDFKRMIHGIHATAAGFRRSPYTVIGFNHSINNFMDYPFPGELSNCVTCHNDRTATQPGTFELPVGGKIFGPHVLATTVNTRSTYTQNPLSGVWKSVADTDPANDLNITPTAAVCTGCHDGREAKSHMVRTGGANFNALQKDIGYMNASGTIVRPGKYVERCVKCHGPGKDKDVRKVHEIEEEDD